MNLLYKGRVEMIIYFVVLAVGLLLWIGTLNIQYNNATINNMQRINRVIFLILSLIIFTVFNVIRDVSVGTDYPMYLYFFKQGDYRFYFDFFINKIYDIAIYFDSFGFITFCVIIVYAVFLFITFYKISINVYTSVLLFYVTYNYVISFNIMRQAAALGIVVFSIMFVIKGGKANFIKFLFLIVMASLFHRSAIFCISFWLFRYMKINKYMMLLSSVFISVSYFSDALKGIINQVLVSLPFYTDKYSDSIDFFFIQNKEKGVIQFLPVLFQILLLLMYIIQSKKETKSLKTNIIICYYYTFLLLYAFSGIEAIDRFQIYLSPATIFFFDEYIFYIWSRKNQLMKHKQGVYILSVIAIMLFWSSYFILRILQGTSGVSPYILWKS